MRGLIFDLDDTLAPREAYLQSGFAAVAASVAASWRRDEAALLDTLRRAHADGHAGTEFQGLCDEHRLPLSLVPAMVHTFRTHAPAVHLAPDVGRTLRDLRAGGWRLGLVTNGLPAVQRRKVHALGLAALIDHVTYAEEHSRRGKPDPEPFADAVCHLRLSASQCVFVGDDLVCDIAGASACGMRTILVRASGQARGAENITDAIRPDAVVASVLDVPAVASTFFRETSRVV